jgi:hypothetical protein
MQPWKGFGTALLASRFDPGEVSGPAMGQTA